MSDRPVTASLDDGQPHDPIGHAIAQEIVALRATNARLASQVERLHKALTAIESLAGRHYSYSRSPGLEHVQRLAREALAATRESRACLECGHPLTDADRAAEVCPYCG